MAGASAATGLALAGGSCARQAIFAGLMVFFGYFTIWMNLFVALALTIPAGSGLGHLRGLFNHPQILACAATSMMLVAAGKVAERARERRAAV